MKESDFLQLIADELMISADAITWDTPFRTIPTWTSLNALLVVSRLHEETGCMITANDIANSTQLKDLFQLIVA